MVIEYAIIIILMIIILYSIFSLNYVMNNTTYIDVYKKLPFTRTRLSDVHDELKTGDLIFSRNAVASFLVDYIIPTAIYKHVAMVIKINGQLYLTESTIGDFFANNDNTEDLYTLHSGVNIVPLKPRLKYFSGLLFIHRLNKSLSKIMEIKLISFVGELSDVKYPTAFSLYINILFNKKISNDLYCYEYIYVLLKHIDLISINKKTVKDISEYIGYIDKYELNQGYHYSKGNLLIYDYYE